MKRFLTSAALLTLLPGTAYAVPYLATVGSPNSLQHTAVSTALDMTEFDPERDEATGEEIEPGTNLIEAAYTDWDAGQLKGSRYDLHYQKAFRPFEGSRARVLVDPFLTILSVKKGRFIPRRQTAFLGTLSTGLELPVKPNWYITPRIAYGATNADQRFMSTSSSLLTLSATSRMKLFQLGRGDVSMGNMIAWSTTMKGGLGRDPIIYVKEQVLAFRNGAAYQLPLKGRMFGGRQASLRASYVWTKLTGDPQAHEDIHEAALSIGVRTREVVQKTKAEQLRIGFVYTYSKRPGAQQFNIREYKLSLGYRF